MGLNFGIWKLDMFSKLYELKKIQTDKKVMEKVQVENEIERIDLEIMLLREKINTASVDRYGAISDFAILTMHKDSLRVDIKRLEEEKRLYFNDLEEIKKELVEVQKEQEQFAYLVEEEKKMKIAKILKDEQEQADEFIQSKYIGG